MVLDLSKVTGATPVAIMILDALVAALAAEGVTVLSLDPHERGLLGRVAQECASIDQLHARRRSAPDA